MTKDSASSISEASPMLKSSPLTQSRSQTVQRSEGGKGRARPYQSNARLAVRVPLRLFRTFGGGEQLGLSAGSRPVNWAQQAEETVQSPHEASSELFHRQLATSEVEEWGRL